MSRRRNARSGATSLSNAETTGTAGTFRSGGGTAASAPFKAENAESLGAAPLPPAAPKVAAKTVFEFIMVGIGLIAVGGMAARLEFGFDSLRSDFDKVETKIEGMATADSRTEVRLQEIQSTVDQTRTEVGDVRASTVELAAKQQQQTPPTQHAKKQGR